MENIIPKVIRSLGMDHSSTYNIYLTGHSLGGLLALHGTYEIKKGYYSKALKRTTTFNGLGIEKFAPKKMKNTLKETEDIMADYIIKGLWLTDKDLVSSIGTSYGEKHYYTVTDKCLEAEGIEDLKIYELWKGTKYVKAMHRLANFYSYEELKNRGY